MTKVQRDKPILIYDGNCGVCRLWIERWKTMTGEAIEYASSQEVASSFPFIAEEEFERSVQLVHPDGTFSSGARAVFESLQHAPGKRWMWWCYRNLPAFAGLSELLYRFIASHRNGFSKISRLLFHNGK